MACYELLPIYNIPTKYQNDVYNGTGFITVLSAADIYHTSLSAVEFNFETVSNPTSAFSWNTPTQVVIDDAINWQFHIDKIQITYSPGLYQYVMVCIDDLGDRRHLMTGRFQIL